MTQESNGNDKFKEWREVKIIENKHICQKIILHTTKFILVLFQEYFAQCTSIFIIEFGLVNIDWKG